MKNLFDQEQKAAKELLNSDKLKGVKDFDVEMHRIRFKGPLTDFGGGKKINPKTGRAFTDLEIDEIGEAIAARNLVKMFETLEKGGKPAKNLKKIAPKVVDAYIDSGRKIPK